MTLPRNVYPHMSTPFGTFCHTVRTGEWLFAFGLTAQESIASQGDILAQTESVLGRGGARRGTGGGGRELTGRGWGNGVGNGDGQTH